MRVDACQFGISDCRKNIIIYQSNITGVSSNTPFVMSIYLHILFNQFFYGSTLWNFKFSDRLLILDFLFSLFRLFLRGKSFRCCMSSPLSSRILYTTEYVFPRCLINAMSHHPFPVFIQPVQKLLPVNSQNLPCSDTLESFGLHPFCNCRYTHSCQFRCILSGYVFFYL